MFILDVILYRSVEIWHHFNIIKRDLFDGNPFKHGNYFLRAKNTDWFYFNIQEPDSAMSINCLNGCNTEESEFLEKERRKALKFD